MHHSPILLSKDIIMAYFADAHAKTHCANLQLDVCILGTMNSSHNDHVPEIERLRLVFPIRAEGAETGECLTLRKLVFEKLNPDPVVSVLDENTPEYHMGEPKSEQSGPSQ